MSSNYHQIEARIQKAIEHLKKNPDAKRAKVAREFDVPLQRLRFRLKGARPMSEVRGVHGRRLSPDQDLALCLYLNKLIKLGLHPRLRMIETAATKLLMQDSIGTTLPPPLSHSWSKRWMDRHPEFRKIKRKPLAAVRKNAEDSVVIRHYFDHFKQQIQEHGICDEDIWNFDETGFRLGIARSDWVLTSIFEDANKRISSKDPDNRESLTAVECINAVGLSIPSFLILTGLMIQSSWVNNDLSNDVVISTAETGYSNDWLSLEWLKHFDKHSAKTQKGAFRLLLMDGYGSHHTIEFIEYCYQVKIIPFGLPAHTTHLLQPLDVVVFQPLKHWHSEAVKEAMSHGDETFTKVEFLNAFNTFRNKAFKKSTILSAWKAVGLVPFNPSIVLDKMPSAPQCPSPRCPDDDYDYDPLYDTPKKLQDMIDAGYLIETHYPMHFNFHRFVKGALAVAREGQLVSDQLALTQAAENSRKVRANQKRQSVQKGGVIRVEECRRMTLQRKEEEDRLELDREMKVLRQQRKRWGPVMRELTRKIPYYIPNGSYGLSCR